ncbi:DUF6456 domain-containing protein [Sulfitobacter sp. JL08]|uniref:DUF6456 domain-containing protein n=1 Tax=Sulfitobacter sp. JL08 TaxID=2070369 RepID=UPI0020C782F3|nr:DUF6456 domain-containing protein [Sulfitobacter sp. JL08]
MTYMPSCTGFPFSLPTWVPGNVADYLAHTESGLSIRALARSKGTHASTILRQIRKLEARRDDPLIDTALRRLGQAHFRPVIKGRFTVSSTKEGIPMSVSTGYDTSSNPDGASLSGEAARILRRLCETGAVLAVATDMEKSVVVRDGPDGASTRTAVVDTTVAQAMALNDWIACKTPGRLSRYKITPAGRTALSRMLAEQENRCRIARESGFAEDQSGFDTQRAGPLEQGADSAKSRRLRYNLAESPFIALARRKDRDGSPFLGDDLVRAGERLREDFELSQMGPRMTQNWDQFLTGGIRSGGAGHNEGAAGPMRARERVAQALSDLGPGLSDVALRCCCFLEGLEMAEKRMGWSARSGKIALRIALQRLKRHYSETKGGAGSMIG